MRTQVAMIGACPSGLLLGQLLHSISVDHVIVERLCLDAVLGRTCAGVVEQTTLDLLDKAGVGARTHAEGLPHDGIELLFQGRRHRIDLRFLSGGKHGTVYGLAEVASYLKKARAAAGLQTFDDTDETTLHGFACENPEVPFKHAGKRQTLRCDSSQAVTATTAATALASIAFRGRPPTASRVLIPSAGWGCWPMCRPCRMDSTTRTQGGALRDAACAARPAAAIAFRCRHRPMSRDRPTRPPGTNCAPGLIQRPATIWSAKSLSRSVSPLRSFAAELMRFGRLFLAGNAAHIVPPTGAKCFHLAASDVGFLLDALPRVWRAERFSWWFTPLLNRFPETGECGRRIQEAEVGYLVDLVAASTSLAGNYVELPMIHTHMDTAPAPT